MTSTLSPRFAHRVATITILGALGCSTDASVWRYARDRFDLAAGESTTARLEAWRVPLE